jgi:hypothetical protein
MTPSESGRKYDVLGVGPRLSAREAASLLDTLVAVWTTTMGEQGTLDRDLELLHKNFYNPVATGRTIRAALAAIPAAKPAPSPAARRLLLQVGPDRFIPTPEGRLAMALLSDGTDAQGNWELRPDAIDDALARLAILYRAWSRHRLDVSVAVLNGAGRPLQLMPIGGVLTLLVDRVDDPERAIRRFPKGSPEAQRLDDAFFAPAAAFANAIKPRKRDTAPERLISGWTLSEVGVRLPGALELSDELGVYVVPGRRDDVIALVIGELKRRSSSTSVVANAYDALCVELERHAPVLAGFGFLFERHAATARLREQLLLGVADG